jgi:hypothetical protein
MSFILIFKHNRLVRNTCKIYKTNLSIIKYQQIINQNDARLGRHEHEAR